MLKNRIELFRLSKEGVKNNIQPFTGSADEFLIKYFTGDLSTESKYKNKISGIDTNSGWFFARFDLAKRRGDFSGDIEQYYREYACDLVNQSGAETLWKKETIDFCKPPEPIKKASSIETIQKYSDSDIYPFTNGVPVSRPNGFGYYEKEYTDNGGRKGVLRYSAPDEKGFVDVAFWYEDRLRWQKKDKVSTLLESIKRKKIISETLTKDLKVISLLKLIRENHIQKKKTINRSFIFEQGGLSDAQAKAKFESLKVYFQDTNSSTKLLNWNDTDLLESIAQKIINLIRQGYKGLMFKYFKTVIELLTQITPGETGKEDELDPVQYRSILTMLNSLYAKYPDAFDKPVPSEMESQSYSVNMPAELKPYFKNSVYRPSSKAPAGDPSTFRTKTQDKTNCQQELMTIYTEAQGGFKMTKEYCETQTFQDRKTFLMGCKTMNHFKQLASNKFETMYNQLFIGNLGTTRLPEECAFKPNRKKS